MATPKHSRLAKNLTTLIIVVVVFIFFYEYKPQQSVSIQQADSTQIVIDSTKIELPKKVINPNTASLEDFLCAGFSKRQAQSCINYRSKGGKFRTVDDLKKIYTISEEDFETIKCYIRIPQTEKVEQKQLSKTEKQVVVNNKVEPSISQVDINSCDTTELKKLPKIGSFRAKKIIEKRDKLGGFYSKMQLYGIYSIDSAVVDEIQRYLIFDTAKIQKININTADFKEINQHPLISYEQTKNIFTYKKIVGNIQTIEELRTNNIILPEDFEILQFYLKTF